MTVDKVEGQRIFQAATHESLNYQLLLPYTGPIHERTSLLEIPSDLNVVLNICKYGGTIHLYVVGFRRRNQSL